MSDQPRKHARHLHDGVQRFATALSFGPHEQVMALVQELRKGMARVDRQRRKHGDNFLLEIAPRPGGAFRL